MAPFLFCLFEDQSDEKFIARERLKVDVTDANANHVTHWRHASM